VDYLDKRSVGADGPRLIQQVETADVLTGNSSA
jgi:hypothetical protein